MLSYILQINELPVGYAGVKVCLSEGNTDEEISATFYNVACIVYVGRHCNKRSTLLYAKEFTGINQLSYYNFSEKFSRARTTGYGHSENEAVVR